MAQNPLEALAAAEARYRGVFMAASDGFIVMNEVDLIVDANPAACSMHGYPAGALVGEAYTRLIAEGCGHIYEEVKSQSRVEDVLRIDSIHRRLDGSRFDVEVRACRFREFEQERVLVSLTDRSLHNRNLRHMAQLSQKILRAQEEERRRVSMELHDELGQLLTAAQLELGLVSHERSVRGSPVDRAAEQTMRLVERAATELRRICRGLRPPVLDDLGLEPALSQLVGEFATRTRTAPRLHVDLDECDRSMPKETALCVYRVVQESLNNVSRHALAASVLVSLERIDDCLVLTVTDDGQGFDAEAVLEGCGLAGMRERGNLVGGRLTVRSRPGEGTRVALHVPLTTRGSSS